MGVSIPRLASLFASWACLETTNRDLQPTFAVPTASQHCYGRTRYSRPQSVTTS